MWDQQGASTKPRGKWLTRLCSGDESGLTEELPLFGDFLVSDLQLQLDDGSKLDDWSTGYQSIEALPFHTW